MTPQELIEYNAARLARHVADIALVDELQSASADVQSTDHQADALAEALFLRVFTAYENAVERLFLHYVTGGASLQGATANTYLRIEEEAHARQLTKAGYKFLSWAKPAEIRTTAQTYIENGWPLVDMMAAKEQTLADCERVRNRIAHNSIEALQQFNVVQRNMLRTERLFPISPGQFLRIRSTRLRKLHIAHYVDVMNETLEALIDPPE
jgi:hypothetical protein